MNYKIRVRYVNKLTFLQENMISKFVVITTQLVFAGCIRQFICRFCEYMYITIVWINYIVLKTVDLQIR
mgnify:CR=1 FL=1